MTISEPKIQPIDKPVGLTLFFKLLDMRPITPQKFYVFPMPMCSESTEAWVYWNLTSDAKAFVKLSVDDYNWWFERGKIDFEVISETDYQKVKKELSPAGAEAREQRERQKPHDWRTCDHWVCAEDRAFLAAVDEAVKFAEKK